MGKQINFFVIDSDEKELIDFIKKEGGTLIDIYLNEISKERINKTIIYSGSDLKTPPITQVFITFSNSKIIKTTNGLLDRISSDVIEFSRTIIRKDEKINIVEPGRIWAEFKYFGERKELLKKEKWFENKFQQYVDWIKKNLKKNKNKDFFIGETAFKLYKEEGYKMMSGPKVEEQF